MSVRRYLVRRLSLVMFVIVGISILTFVVTRIVPSNPALLYAGPMARASAVAEAEKVLRLDRPLYEQYGSYVAGLVQGDWGISFRTHRPVLGDVAIFLPVTLQLVTIALLFSLVVGVWLGALTAHKKGKVIDFVMRVFAVGGVSAPSFFVALVFQVIMFRVLDLILPVAGMFSVETMQAHPIAAVTGAPLLDALLTGNFPALADGLRHSILPVLALAAYPTGMVMRMTRSAMLESLNQDYVKMARAMGVPDSVTVNRYALKNSLGPVLTIVGLTFAYSIIGAFFIEIVFSWPGIGTYAMNSILGLDYPAIMGVTLIVAFIYVLVNLVVDLLIVWLDPRVVLS